MIRRTTTASLAYALAVLSAGCRTPPPPVPMVDGGGRMDASGDAGGAPDDGGDAGGLLDGGGDGDGGGGIDAAESDAGGSDAAASDAAASDAGTGDDGDGGGGATLDGCAEPVCPPPPTGCTYLEVTPCFCGILSCETSCGTATCSETEYCEHATPGACGGGGVCTARPDRSSCPVEYLPVCGCDGATYTNECDAHALGVDDAFEGECPPVTDCRVSGCPPGQRCLACPGAPSAVCLPDGVGC